MILCRYCELDKVLWTVNILFLVRKITNIGYFYVVLVILIVNIAAHMDILAINHTSTKFTHLTQGSHVPTGKKSTGSHAPI